MPQNTMRLHLSARHFLSSVWALARPYWVSEERWIARGLLAAVVGMTLFQIFLDVQFNEFSKNFYNALQNKDIDDFWSLILWFSFLAAVWIITVGYNLYLNLQLQIRWRRWLTNSYLDDWLRKRVYYRMELKSYGTDNVDQRIQEDLRDFASLTLSLGLDLLGNVVTLVTFSTILWTLSGAITVTLGGTPIAIPGYMMWVAIIYAIVGSWLTHRIGKPLAGLNFNQQRFEADFRYGLVRLRENAEGIATYGGEQDEKRGLSNRFGNVWQNWWQLMTYRKRLAWFQSGYAQLAIIFPVVVVAPRYFSGAIQFGQIFQTTQAFGQVQNALSWFVSAYTQLAQWRATVDRLLTFHHAIERAASEASAKAGIRMTTDSGDGIVLHGVDVALPDGKPLLSDASLELRPGEDVLLTGASGSGKSTLFRAISGIWPFGSGEVHMPASGQAMFLPQRPYLPIGSLRDAVAFPSSAQGIPDEQIREALRAVRLEDFADRLEETDNWSQRLSPGEQQRVAFARALLHRPAWLFLDEATASLDEEMEQHLYELMQERLPDTTLISIAHRPSVATYHQRRIALVPEASGARRVVEVAATA